VTGVADSTRAFTIGVCAKAAGAAATAAAAARPATTRREAPEEEVRGNREKKCFMEVASRQKAGQTPTFLQRGDAAAVDGVYKALPGL